jgi:uncharacterized membrane protein
MFTICNRHPSQVWVAIMFYNTDACGGEGGNFQTKGWWSPQPGSCVRVFGGDVSDVNRYWYYYAEDGSGTVWAGEFSATVPQEAFTGCVSIGVSTQRTIGFRQLDVGDSDNFTLNLTG